MSRDRRLLLRVWVLALAMAWVGWGVGSVGAESPRKRLDPPKNARRIVFLGDSITDGNSGSLLVRQALEEAKQPVPVMINAGIAGDTARGMRKRIGRDVLVHRPDLVSLSVGINDVLHKVKVADYEADVRAISAQLDRKHIPMLILTTSILGPKLSEADKRLDGFNTVLRRLAKHHGYPVAEVNEAMHKARAAGRNVLEEDQVHPNYQGHRLMARAVLNGLGYDKIGVPKELKVNVMPGIVRAWRIRPVPDKQPPLDEKSAGGLKPDGSWKVYSLPEQKPLGNWWLDQERKRGFAVSLDKRLGPGKSYQGIAFLEEKQPRTVYFNTGAQLQTIWLNGKRLYRSEGWTGWHAGKERIKSTLRAGRNTLVIETGSDFFLSVTDDNQW
jgi:acyl-CoA thioesterase-1